MNALPAVHRAGILPSRRCLRLPGAAAALVALGAALAMPAVSHAAAGDIATLPGADGCQATEMFTRPAAFTGTCTTARFRANLTDAAMAPDGKTLYLSSGEDGQNTYSRLDLLRRDPVSGTLSPVAGAAGCVDSDIGDAECATLGDALDPRKLLFEEVVVAGDVLHVATRSTSRPSGIQTFERAQNGALIEASCVEDLKGGTVKDPCTGISGLTGINDMALSPDGKQLYVSAAEGTSLHILDRDPITGALTQRAGTSCYSAAVGTACQATRGGGLMRSIVVSPDGKHLYWTGGGGRLSFARDPATGGLTQLSDDAGCAVPGVMTGCENDPYSDTFGRAAMTPDGKQLLVVDPGYPGVLRTYGRDGGTGALTVGPCFRGSVGEGCTTAMPSFDSGPTELVVTPDGTDVYLFGSGGVNKATVQGFSRNTATGALAPLAAPGGCVAYDAAYGCSASGPNPEATLLVAAPDGRHLYAGGGSALLALRREVPDLAAPDITITSPRVTQADATPSVPTFTQNQVVLADYACTDDVAVATCTGPVADDANLDTSTVVTNKAFKVDATDTSGNASSKTHFYSVVAATSPAPQVTISTPPLSLATYFQGQAVTAAYGCTDATSCVGPVADGQRLDTSTLGRRSFEVVARNAAGAEERRTHFYDVVALSFTPSPATEPESPPAVAPSPATVQPVSPPAVAPSAEQQVSPPPPPFAPSKLPPAKPTAAAVAQTRLAGLALESVARQPSSVDGKPLLLPKGSLDLNLRAKANTDTKASIVGRIDSGGRVIAAGGGNVVAAGGGNLLGRGGGSAFVPDRGDTLRRFRPGLWLAARTRPARRPPKLVTIAKGKRYFAKAGSAKVKVKLTRAGRALLKKRFKRRGRQKVKLTFVVGMTERGAGGPTVVATKTITIRE